VTEEAPHNRRVGDVPEERPPAVHHDADYIVEQAVERAAVKVAAAVPTACSSQPLLSKMGSVIAVALIITVELINVTFNLITRNDLTHHNKDFKALCQVVVQFSPPERITDLAKTLAECLK